MNSRLRFLPALLAIAGCIVLPSVHAEDKKKKKDKAPKEESPGNVLEQLKDQLERQMRQPVAPVPSPAVNGPPVKVRLANYTGRPVEMIWMNPNGTQQSYGQLAPTDPGGPPAVMDTYGGHMWLFKSGGRVIQTFTASNQRVQDVQLGQPPAVQIPPAGTGGNQSIRVQRGVVLQDQMPPPVVVVPPAARGAGDAAPRSAQEFLQIHNDARARVGVPPLRWSATLARYAQEWADRLAATGTFQHRDQSATGYGENMFGGSEGSPGDAARYWLEERAVYRGGPITPQNFNTVGHYTQMVWRDTTEVGYGIARGANGVVVVANYAPRGNRNGMKPF